MATSDCRIVLGLNVIEYFDNICELKLFHSTCQSLLQADFNSVLRQYSNVIGKNFSLFFLLFFRNRKWWENGKTLCTVAKKPTIYSKVGGGIPYKFPRGDSFRKRSKTLEILNSPSKFSRGGRLFP